MCGPVAGILSAVAPFVPLISRFIGGGNRQQQQAPQRSPNRAGIARLEQRQVGGPGEDKTTTTEERKTRYSAGRRNKIQRDAASQLTGGAQQTEADAPIVNTGAAQADVQGGINTGADPIVQGG
tara:strand:+ start:193 stop:564 length:372 start_codon:yes stop_codon:yes gene_type:complete